MVINSEINNTYDSETSNNSACSNNSSIKIQCVVKYGTKYSRMDQV